MTKRSSSIFLSIVGIFISLPFSAPALSQKADCGLIAMIFEVDDWKTLANGPFVDMRKLPVAHDRRAPAKSLLPGLGNCTIWNAKSFTQKTETDSYTCSAPLSTARGKDFKSVMNEVNAVAAPWRSCFGGWKETSDGGDFAEQVSAVLRFEKADREVSFGRYY